MTKLRVVISSAVTSLFVSAIAGFAHADRIVIAGVRIPFGLVLALIICLLTILWLNRKFQTRLAGTVFLVIWVLVTLRMAIESTGGDLIFTVTWYSTAYIIAGAILLSMIAVLPAMRVPAISQHVDPESQA
jgi:Ca2+/Na+ antiporter